MRELTKMVPGIPQGAEIERIGAEAGDYMLSYSGGYIIIEALSAQPLGLKIVPANGYVFKKINNTSLYTPVKHSQVVQFEIPDGYYIKEKSQFTVMVRNILTGEPEVKLVEAKILEVKE